MLENSIFFGGSASTGHLLMARLAWVFHHFSDLAQEVDKMGVFLRLRVIFIHIVLVHWPHRVVLVGNYPARPCIRSSKESSVAYISKLSIYDGIEPPLATDDVAVTTTALIDLIAGGWTCTTNHRYGFQPLAGYSI